MKYWVTKLKALEPKTGIFKTYCGPNVPGISHEDAERYCQENGLGYCEVDGELVAEIPTKEDGVTPDWSKAIDYEKVQQN